MKLTHTVEGTPFNQTGCSTYNRVIKGEEYLRLQIQQIDIQWLKEFLQEGGESNWALDFKKIKKKKRVIVDSFFIRKNKEGVFFNLSKEKNIAHCIGILKALTFYTSNLYIRLEVNDEYLYETEEQMPMDDELKEKIKANRILKEITKVNQNVKVHFELKMSFRAIYRRNLCKAIKQAFQEELSKAFITQNNNDIKNP